MKLVIAGGRDVTDPNVVNAAFAASGIDVQTVTEIISGGARGVDAHGETFASAHDLPVRRFPADWNRFSYRAGPMRNRQMAEYGDALLAIWDGQSPGTKSMISLAKARGIPVYIYRYDLGALQ